MRIQTLRNDLEAIDKIINIVNETDIDIYIDKEEDQKMFNKLLNEIRLNIIDMLSIKELVGIYEFKNCNM